MRSLHQIVSDNLKAVATGTIHPDNVYKGERPDPGFPWTVVLSIADDGSTLYTVVNNQEGIEGDTYTHTNTAHQVARAKNLALLDANTSTEGC